MLQLRSRLLNRVRATLMAADNVSLPSDIVELQFPTTLPELRVQLTGAAPPAASPPAAQA